MSDTRMRMRLIERLPGTLVLLVILAFAAASNAQAQRVYWEPDHGTLGYGKVSNITLIFEDCRPDGEVTLPPVDGLEFGSPALGEQTTSDFTRTTVKRFRTYPVQPTRYGTITIPAFDVRTDRGRIAVGEVRFEVTDASVGQAGVSINELMSAQLRPSRSTVWVGEVIDIEYILLGSPRFQWNLATAPDWRPGDLVVEPFGEPERVQGTINGERRSGVRYRTRAMATQAGTISLSAVQQHVNVQTGERAGFFFSQPRIEVFAITSDQPQITVRPLPQPTPATFSGAVGEFSLESKLVPQSARVGEPITWTLTLRGRGNWPAHPGLPQREVAADFQVVQPQARQQMDDGRLFSGSLTEDAVLVPTRPGTYTIGPISFTYFNTVSGTFQTEEISPITVTIEPAAAPTLPSAPTTSPSVAPGTDGAGAPGTGASERGVRLPQDLPPVKPLPQDPLEIGQSALAPFSAPMTWWVLSVFVPPVLAWVICAWREMLRTDDLRARRAVRRELEQLLVRFGQKSRDSNADLATLAAWRTLAARLWRIKPAAPSAEDFAQRITAEAGETHAREWTRLWVEAETALFSARATLPEDWTSRALQVVRSAPLRPRSARLPLRAAYWIPRTAIVAFLFLSVANPSGHAAAASDALRAYQEGRFTDAYQAWQAAVASNPHDWAAHNNLALAAAQQERWGEAAAHWTAAFLLNPREDSIRANLRVALAELDGIDARLRRLLTGSWIDRIATTLSPAEWQLLLFAGGGAIGLGLIMLVLGLYFSRAFAWRPAGWVLLIVGGVVSIGGMAGRDRYGVLGHPDAGLLIQPGELRSVPSDLAETQQTSPVSAGTIVVWQRTFLGWERVQPDADTGGWIRRESIVPFFRAPPIDTTPAPTTGSAAQTVVTSPQSPRPAFASSFRPGRTQ